MKSVVRVFIFIALFGLITAVFPAGALPPGTDNYNKNAPPQEGTCEGGEGNSLTYDGPEKLWPPNHKYYQGIDVTASGQKEEDITLATSGTHNQYEGDLANGSGNTADDITVDDEEASITSEEGAPQVLAVESGTEKVTTSWKARAERSGKSSDGRTYTITATASFEDEGTCTGSWTIKVPHDMSPKNR